MNTIIVAKAQPIVLKQGPFDACIAITGQLPQFETLEEAAAYYTKYAREIERVLISTLPGGMYDRLLGLMLKRKATHFRVAHDTYGKKEEEAQP